MEHIVPLYRDKFFEDRRRNLKSTARAVGAARSRLALLASLLACQLMVSQPSPTRAALEDGPIEETTGKVELRALMKGCSVSITQKDPQAVCIPREACEYLLLRCGREEIPVLTKLDLQGKVEIREPEEALQYLRFFSSKKTYYFFRDPYVEIYPAPEDECISPCLPSERWNELGLHQASVTSTRDGWFEVTRNIVRRDGPAGNPRLYTATEAVSSDGQIELLKQISVPTTRFDEVWLMFPGAL